MDSFGDRLARLRKTLSLSQEKLAKEIKVSQRAISALENTPGRVPSSENLQALAAFFQVDAEWLLTGAGERSTVTGLSEQEKELLQLFRGLSPAGRAYMLARVEDTHRDEHRDRKKPIAPKSSPDSDERKRH